MLRLSICREEDWPERLRGEWNDLLEASPSATMFQTWEWQTAWWTHYRGRQQPWILQFHEKEILVGLMPLAATRGLWRALVPIGHGKSDYLQPLARSGYEDAVGRAVADYLQGENGFDFLRFDMIRETEPLRAHLDPSCLQPADDCYIRELGADFDAYFATLSERMVRYLKKFDREFKVTGGYSVELAEGDQRAEAIEALIRLHTLRWNARGQPGGLAFAKIRGLFRDWSASAEARGWLRLHVLRHQGEPVGAILAATLNQACFCHVIGFDPAHGAIRPGWVLYRESIRQAVQEGASRYDFMLGTEEYKSKWAPQMTIANLTYQWIRPNLRGRLARFWHEKGRPSLVVLRRRAANWARGLRGRS